jgi:L-fuconolactonase
MSKIDAHQHFWHYNPNEFSWIDSKMQALRRDYLPTDLIPLLQASGIDGTICVQARQSHAENDWLLELADQNPFILAVVGWADVCDPRLPEHLKKLSVHAKLRGIRYILVEEADDQFMLRNDFVRGISCLAEVGLTYDLLICPRHLPVAYELVRRFPKQSFVVDHIALPSIKNKEFEPWARHIKLLADCQNLYCKISGMVTEADWENWNTGTARIFSRTSM